MSQGARNWPFLTLTGLPVRGRRDQEIGLAAEKGRDLQQIDGLGDGGAVLGRMHVGGDGKAGALSDLGEDGKRLFEPEPAGARGAGAVRLVERALVDEAELEPASDLLERLRRLQCMRAAFQHARSCNQRERRVLREASRADLEPCLGPQGLVLVHMRLIARPRIVWRTPWRMFSLATFRSLVVAPGSAMMVA